MISLFDSLLNFRFMEEANNKIIDSQGPFEIRLYMRMAYARVYIPGDFSTALEEGKKCLQDYLDGSNFRVEKVPSTTLYFQTEREKGWDIGVILPAEKITTEFPRPINRQINLDELAPGKVAVLKLSSGQVTEEIFERRTGELFKWIEFKKHKTLAGARLVYNDSLITLPFKRTREVHLDLL